MNRYILSAIASAVTLAAILPAQASTATSDFTVSVSLAAKCTAQNSGVQTLDFGTYTAFTGAATKNPTVDLTFNCTRGLAAPTYSFDTSSYGVLAGLNYSLSAAKKSLVAGTAATAVSGGVGSADALTVTVTGDMADGQAGACAGVDAATCAAAAVTTTRTLTVTY